MACVCGGVIGEGFIEEEAQGNGEAGDLKKGGGVGAKREVKREQRKNRATV